MTGVVANVLSDGSCREPGTFSKRHGLRVALAQETLKLLICSQTVVIYVSKSSVGRRLMDEHTIFGYPIPMPRSDLYIALATVAGFLPAVVVVHHLVAFIGRRVARLLPSARKQD